MKIGFLGDSITEGVGASIPSKNFVSQVELTLGCSVVNYGLSGTRIARQKENSYCHRWDIDFNLRVPLLDKSLDYMFVFGGTNDYGHGLAPWGNSGDTDCYTFHGAVNTLLSSLVNIYGKEKVVVLSPLKRARALMQTNKNSVTDKYLVEYVQVIKDYAERYGVSYIDLYNEFPEPPKGESEFFADGLHPNDDGHRIIAEKICNFIKNNK